MMAKVGIIDQEEAVVARQGCDKCVSAATDTDTTIEDTVLSMRTFVTMVL
jgi:hypothetical protein